MRVRLSNPYLKFPLVSLCVTAVVCLPLLLAWFDFDVSAETRILLEGDQRNLASYEKTLEILQQDTVVVISLKCAEVFSSNGIDAVRRVSEAFERQPGLVDVKSFTHAVKPVRVGFTFAMVPLVSVNPDAAELERLREYALANPLIRNVMVSPDCQHTVILATYRRDLSTPGRQAAFCQEIRDLLRPFEAEGLEFEVFGVPFLESEVRAAIRSDAQWFIPATLVVLVGILWFTFRSLGVVVLVLVNQMAGLLLIPGLVSLMGLQLNVFSLLLFPLLTATHLTLLVHLLNAWQQARRDRQEPDVVLRATLREILRPSTFAALTTGIGLLSLVVSDVRQVREFGVLGAMGVAVIYGLTFGPGLAVLQLFSRRQGSAARRTAVGHAGSGAAWLHRVALARWKLALGMAGLSVMVAVIGFEQIQTDVRAVEFLGPKSPIRRAVMEWDQLYGGINVVQLEFDTGVTNGVNALPFLTYLQDVQRHAESLPEVTAAYSYAQLLSLMNQVWEQEKPGSYRLPDNALVLSLFTIALRVSEYPFLAALVDDQARTAYFVVRTRDMPADRYLRVVHQVVDYAEQHRPSGVTVSAAKGLHSIQEADRRILRSIVNTAGIALGAIGLILALLWRSPGLAVRALGANVIAIALGMAAAGYARLPLNSITVMAAAICLGIAVDDAVHFVTHWREQQRRGLSPAEALRATFLAKTRPIVSSSVILLGVFLLFGAFSFPPLVHFGILAAASFGAALVAVLFLLPALLTGGRPAR